VGSAPLVLFAAARAPRRASPTTRASRTESRVPRRLFAARRRAGIRGAADAKEHASRIESEFASRLVAW